MKLAHHRHSFPIHHLPKFSYNVWIILPFSLYTTLFTHFRKMFSQILKCFDKKKKRTNNSLNQRIHSSFSSWNVKTLISLYHLFLIVKIFMPHSLYFCPNLSYYLRFWLKHTLYAWCLEEMNWVFGQKLFCFNVSVCCGIFRHLTIWSHGKMVSSNDERWTQYIFGLIENWK